MADDFTALGAALRKLNTDVGTLIQAYKQLQAAYAASQGASPDQPSIDAATQAVTGLDSAIVDALKPVPPPGQPEPPPNSTAGS